MGYNKYPCLSHVMWRGKRCMIVAIQHGHEKSLSAGNIYTVRFAHGSRHYDYPNIPESELSPVPEDHPVTNEVLQIVAEHNRLAALSTKHLELVKA